MTVPTGTLHHVGIVMHDFAAAEEYMQNFDHVEDYRGFVDAFSCWCIFLKAPEGSSAVELVIPDGGPLAEFNPPIGGLHHYAYETDDIVAQQAKLAERGIRMLEEQPVKGAGNFLCNFVHPFSTRGLIIEYIQML